MHDICYYQGFAGTTNQVFTDCPLNLSKCTSTGDQKCYCPRKELHCWAQKNPRIKIVENENCCLRDDLRGYITAVRYNDNIISRSANIHHFTITH